MILSTLDWTIIFGFFGLSLAIGLYVSRRAGESAAEFFLSSRSMPWWLLGVSMVATTFSCDTPNLVTDIVRQNGVSGNWSWWAFLLTGMLTVFVYARLWQRSQVLTDLEFYEIRYSGEVAGYLRGFRALYLGVLFNILVMASVCLAMIKIGAVMLQWSALQTLLVISTITVIYSTLGGLRGILLTDFFQFFISMIGAIGGALVLLNLPDVGGLQNLLSHENVIPKLNLLPDFSDSDAVLTLLILPLAVQWWSVWYPGAEPGGGGYVAQRMLAAKSEPDAVGGTLLFNAAHYALRPWPWIIVALASLVVFPDLASMREAFPNVDPAIIQHDFAYPAMLSFLPSGLLGLVVAGLIAAFMSTISTHLNWGASYIVNDYYKRFMKPDATEQQLVQAGRISIVVLMAVTVVFALLLSNALQAFQILLQIGAGTGLIYILRWFWWRINAYSEIAAMVVSFLVALYFQFAHTQIGFEPLSGGTQLLAGVIITTLAWLGATFATEPTDANTLYRFYELVHPGGPGWKAILLRAKQDGRTIEDPAEGAWDVPAGILAMLTGCLAVYSLLFSTGYWIYGKTNLAIMLTALAAGSIFLLMRLWKKVGGTA